MSILAESIRGKSWILKITLMSVVLGMLLAVSLKTQQRVRSESGLPSTRFPEVASAYSETKRQNQDLRKQIDDLNGKVRDYETELANSGKSTGVLSQELQASRFLSGLTAARGSGVIVTLRDSAKEFGREGIIHDTDIYNIVNELRSAGAEIISVNDQRLIATTAIRCAGAIISINEVEVAGPYEVKAIGKPSTLEGALRMRGGIIDFFPDPKMIDIQEKNNIYIKAYDGSTQFKFAKPAE